MNEWVRGTVRKAMQEIHFTEALKLSEVGKRQYYLHNWSQKPSMDYKEVTFDLLINFGDIETYKNLYTPDFTRTLEQCLAPVSEKLEEPPKDGKLTKSMTVSIHRSVK